MKAEPSFRAVIDTNVWISAALAPTGAPAAVAWHLLAHGAPVFSQATFDELQMRLWKPKFDRYLSVEQRQSLLHDLSACALWVEVPQDLSMQTFSRDRDDDAFIHAALVASAPWLITGDQDLLTVQATLPMTILTPAQALARADFMSAAAGS